MERERYLITTKCRSDLRMKLPILCKKEGIKPHQWIAWMREKIVEWLTVNQLINPSHVSVDKQVQCMHAI